MRRFYYLGSRAAELDRLRAQGWNVVTFKAAPVVVAWEVTESGKVFAKAWRGAADKPAWHYSFRDATRARAYVDEYVAAVTATEKRCADAKAEKRAKRAGLKASDHWTAGDVIYNSWGYDQTNLDFYQVTEVKAKSVVIRRIKQNSDDCGGPSGGKAAPRRFEFCGEPMLKPLDAEGRVSFRHGGGIKWDGRAIACSSYH